MRAGAVTGIGDDGRDGAAAPAPRARAPRATAPAGDDHTPTATIAPVIPRRAAFLVPFGLALPLVAQTTWTVNSAGGAMFTAIQPAIAAAAPGDRIEVQGAGPYGAFLVDRGVEIECTVGAICGAIEVVGVPLGQRVRVSGFVVDLQTHGRVSVRTCAGSVGLANVAYTGTGTFATGALPGLEVLDSPTVLVDHCDFRGHTDAVAGAPGVAITNSQVAFVGGSLVGGVLASGSTTNGDDGRAGVVVVGSHVVATGVTWRGGPSSSGTTTGGDGGDAVHVVSGVAIVNGYSQLRCGFGSGGGIPGQHGLAARGNVRLTTETLLIGSTSGATTIAQRPVIQAPGGAFVGTTATWYLAGPAGQLVAFALDLDWLYAPLPAFDGALVLTPNFVLVSALVLDAQGTASHALTIPNNPALRHLTVYAQGLAFFGGNVVLTGGTATHLF